MTVHRFKDYLHGDDPYEMVEHLVNQGISEDVAERIAETRPFYEVTMECEFDTETGQVTLIRAKL